MAEKKTLFCVIGAGNGGMAMAGHLSLMGFPVNLYNRHEERLLTVKTRGGIELDGELNGFGRLNLVTTDLKAAIEGARVLMITVPAFAHSEVAASLAPLLKGRPIILLNPGRTGGALEFQHILKTEKCAARSIIAEAQTFLYASRVENPGRVRIFRIKNSVPVAALPSYRTPEILKVITPAFPQFVPVANVLVTSFNNIGAVFHPAITLLNAARIQDTHGNFQFYIEGVTRAVARVLEEVDRERVAVASALGVGSYTARQWLYLAYNVSGNDLYAAMMANEGYYGIKAPPILETRYLTEDVPMSLVPIASIGEALKVDCPTINTIIHLCSLLLEKDFRAEGRTAAKLGLQGLSVKEIRYLVTGVAN